jgi:hypothetical protein
MTSPPSPPNRRRRRIVVGMIAVLVVGLGWWVWPRADQRFVGKWVRVVPQTSGLGENVYVFQPDGRGSCGSEPDGETGFDWEVRGSYLQLIYGRRPGIDGLVDRIQNLFGRPSRMYEGQRYFIVEMSTNRTMWQLVSPGQRITAESDEVFELRRVQ